MGKNKLTNKLKEGVSVEELEKFARNHTTEVFSILTLVIASISSAFRFFTGAGWAIIFASFGCILTILFPAAIERGLRQFYNFVGKQEKAIQMVLGGVKIIIAIFLPFILFGILGILAGSSYHFYLRHAQLAREHRAARAHAYKESDEHD